MNPTVAPIPLNQSTIIMLVHFQYYINGISRIAAYESFFLLVDPFSILSG